MFKSAATKIAHNTTIPALAGNSDLRPLQDLITAEKTVLMTLQKLRIDLVKAGDALRVWGQGEGDDLGDVLTASSTMLAHFAAALSTYSSLHHTVRDSMKSVRTREEVLEDLRRRRRRVGSSAEAAEKKLHKMGAEHKNLVSQMDTLNKLRDEMRAMDEEIVREETELGDYKRRCTKDWMGFKFGGLVECCEKGIVAGDVGRRITQFIPEDVTQTGFQRPVYDAHGRVNDLVVEAQRAVSQVTFSVSPSGRASAISQAPPPASQGAPAQSPFLPTPSLGSELTLGMGTYSPPPGPPPGHPTAALLHRRASVDELGVHVPSPHAPPQFFSLPANRERDPIPASSSSAGPAQPPSPPALYDSKVARTEENQSLMASINDALSQSHRGFSLEEAALVENHAPDEPAPKYEPIGDVGRSAWSEPHAPVTNGHAGLPPLAPEEGQWQRRATRRSTSPPSLPPGAAPAAIRAWDDRLGQGEDGANSDRPASSSARMASQRLISSSERDGEEEGGLAYDHESQNSQEEGRADRDGRHQNEDMSLSESGGEASADATKANYHEQDETPIQESVSTDATSDAGDSMPLPRAGNQWQNPHAPPSSVGAGTIYADDLSARERRGLYTTGLGAKDDTGIRTDEPLDERVLNAVAAREVSRAVDALAFSAVAPSPGGYDTPRGSPPERGTALSMQSEINAPYPQASLQQLPSPSERAPQGSTPSSPAMSSYSPPSYRSGASPETRQPRRRQPTSMEGLPPRLATPTPTPAITVATPLVSADVPTPSRPTPPVFRSPPPEYPRPTPPFSAPLMASSTSSLNSAGGGGSPGGAPRTITAAAFRRQQARSPSMPDVGPADTSPLTLRKASGLRQPQAVSGLPSPVSTFASEESARKRLSVVNPDPQFSNEEEGGEEKFDYIGAYLGEGAGYGTGKYVSDLEKER